MGRLVYLFAIVVLLVIAAVLIGPWSQTGMISGVSESIFFRYEEVTYNADVKVIEVEHDGDIPLGMNTDTDHLAFGELPQGGSFSTRYINVNNDEEYPIKIKLEASGPIASQMTFKENNFILDTNTIKKIPITVTAENLPPGTYSGQVKVTSIIPKNSLGENILPWL